MKTFTKFLPIALALMLGTGAVFAAAGAGEQDKASSTMTIVIPSYTEVTVNKDSYNSSGVTIGAGYSTFAYTGGAFDPTFTVYNNDPKATLVLSANCTGSENAALGGKIGGLKLAFSNSTSGEAPISTAVEDALADKPKPHTNANVIAFTLTPDLKKTAETGVDESIPEGVYSTNQVTYSNVSNGVYTFKYTVGTDALAQTFSTDDMNGTYTSILTLTNTNP